MRILTAMAMVLALAWGACAGEGSIAQPYEKIRYPTFANGRLQSMLEADQAEAYDLAEDTPRINLRNVIITLYDQSEETLASTPDDQPLPVKMTITSDRGYFTRRVPDPGGKPEEIANLEGNVVLRQMRLAKGEPVFSTRPRRLDPSIETEVHCQHAQWNNTLRKLNGDGEVEFIQEDSRIVGTGFLYLADDDALEGGGGTSNIKNWGGIIFIEHNARMEIDRDPRAGESGRTTITCKDTASYKLREREIQFEREVRIRRPGLLIESDILKVFLRREEDPQPEGAEEAAPAPVPGMVRSIIATIGTRPGSVVVTGYDLDDAGGETLQYTARGGRADFDYDSNRITLTDTRLERTPEVEFMQDRISDRNLEFIFAQTSAEDGSVSNELELLTTVGGQGQVMLRSRQAGVNTQPGAITSISYKGEMNYSRIENRIRLRDSVFLKQGDLRIRSESLDVRIAQMPDGSSRVNRIVAETDVNIMSGNREARAQRAEYEIQVDTAAQLDVLRLFGPPTRTPPHPWIRDDYGNRITAPIIYMQRLEAGTRDKPLHLLTASGGVSVCDFYTAPDNLVDKGKIISIKCENGMEYNEEKRIASFHGQVMAASDAPEDNYVLTSDRLDIYLAEIQDPDDAADTVIRLRRIDANGSARLMQDTRICEAHQIIRDFPSLALDEGDIYLEGLPPAGGRPGMMAVYREQIGTAIGSMFSAPRIMSTAKGNLIRANGPGQLSMPDEIPGFRSEIHFDGAALYESLPDGIASEAKFRKGVTLRQPSRNLVITADEVDARFMRNPNAETDEDETLERIGQLRRAEGRVNVTIEHALPRQGRRVATGDRGVVEFTDTGNSILLSVNQRPDGMRWAMARDHDGMTLLAPQIEVREAQGVTRASGPGELQLPGNQGSDSGVTRVPTRVAYGENGMMVYNELALNIRVSDNVRIVQPGLHNNWNSPSLDGRCDRLEITLLEPPAPGLTGDEAMSRVSRMDAVGAVLLRVFADPPPENPNIDWLSRPGTTFFTRGDQGVFDVPEGRVVISALPGRQPQLLLNMVDEGSPPRRQRMKADRFILNTNTMPRRWYFEGQLDSRTLREGEAFEFEN